MEYMRIGRNIRDLDVPFQDEIKFSIKKIGVIPTQWKN